jgi:hypothetical protein
MKGVVLTEFVDFVDEAYTPAAAAAVRERLAGLCPGGYSAVGSYAHEELLELARVLARAAEEPEDAVLERYGSKLFERFAALYPVFFVDADGALSFLERINTDIHAEVKKLYPDARFPAFECSTPEPGRLDMVYRSSRPLASLACGLIRGCIAYFGDRIDLERQDVAGAEGREAHFVLTRPRPRRRRRAERAGDPASAS